jgi:signal transduction histidine kinase
MTDMMTGLGPMEGEPRPAVTGLRTTGTPSVSSRAGRGGSRRGVGRAAVESESESTVELLRAQLAQAQRMAALGELLSTTTHEFNNLLMTIINYAQLGLRHKDQPTRDKALEKILAAGQRAAKVTQSVLGMARNRSTGLEATDLTRLLEDSLVLLERELMKHRITLEKQFQSVPEVWANGNQIQQVILNLIINARQAMNAGGTLTLKLEYDAASKMVDLVVRDTGSGISAEQLPRIFDAYYTTKHGPDESGKGGTGLGLSSCRTIIEAHQGRIRVESTVGRGTAFTIKLPVAPSAR